jgi:hypothetical protein
MHVSAVVCLDCAKPPKLGYTEPATGPHFWTSFASRVWVQQRPYRDGTSQLHPYQNSGGSGGLWNSSQLNPYQAGRAVLWGWGRVESRSISPPQSHSHPPSHKSLETSLVVQLTWTNGYHTQRHSKSGTCRIHLRSDTCCLKLGALLQLCACVCAYTHTRHKYGQLG